jgi:hypothetical protein
MHLLEPLLVQPVEMCDLRSAVRCIYLQVGNLEQAERHFAVVMADAQVPASMKDVDATFLVCAQGGWGIL